LTFLLEIGAEEIPDHMIDGALEHLRAAIGNLLRVDVRVDGTPRRLAVRAEGVIEREPDAEEVVTGPATTAPQGAVAGFAKKLGVDPSELQKTKTAKGEYYTFVKKIPGRRTADILASSLPSVILSTPFPKTMYWAGKGSERFIRPIRWVVALLGGAIVPFEIAGVKSGNHSSGHRTLGEKSFSVAYENYEQKLRENFVILSADERYARIRESSVHYKCDRPLLKTLTNITEYPTPIVGHFEEEFLALPKEVLITVMRYHQKYLSVESKDGQLLPQFVAVMNLDADRDGLIQRGNERVLKARFNDARFFWDTDQKKPLRDRLDDLSHVTFQAKLGSYLEKTRRMESLVRDLGGDQHALRAAELSKTDLTTELVKEFTELQGVVGGLYARAQGEPEEVAQAIYDHYKPVSMEDSIPSTQAGQIVSIADKLDTLRGCFQIGLIPSGSKDPFALRRAAQGIVRIIVEGGLRLDLKALLVGDAKLEEFFLDRVRYYFRDIRGFKYDEINAVLASGWSDLIDVAERLTAIQAVRPTPNFEPLAASFKRISNILRQAQFGGAHPIDATLLESGPEAELHSAYIRTLKQTKSADYRSALETIAALRPRVDLFFDKVLVNAPDERVRANRLALLDSMRREFSTIADFSEIVTTSQETKA
jgi:glycyl-tRNA synthetase beta chain